LNDAQSASLPHGEIGLVTTTNAVAAQSAEQQLRRSSINTNNDNNGTTSAVEEGRTTHIAMLTNLMGATTKRFDSFTSPCLSPSLILSLSLSLFLALSRTNDDDEDDVVGSQHNTIYRCQSYRTHTRRCRLFTIGGSQIWG